MAASPIYERAGLVHLGITDSHPDFTNGGGYMFSTSLSPVQDAACMAKTAFDLFGGKQALLYRNTDWGKVTCDLYIENLNTLGNELTTVENDLENERDLRSLLA